MCISQWTRVLVILVAQRCVGQGSGRCSAQGLRIIDYLFEVRSSQ